MPTNKIDVLLEAARAKYHAGATITQAVNEVLVSERIPFQERAGIRSEILKELGRRGGKVSAKQRGKERGSLEVHVRQFMENELPKGVKSEEYAQLLANLPQKLWKTGKRKLLPFVLDPTWVQEQIGCNMHTHPVD